MFLAKTRSQALVCPNLEPSDYKYFNELDLL
jgi:hypothetical protein